LPAPKPGGKLHTHDVALVIGTRPEAIKLAPLAAALRRRGISVVIILTGQQPLDPAAYRLDSFLALDLGCRGRSDPQDHVRSVVGALAGLLNDSPPALLVVQGDTSSALGGTLAASIAGVPIAHVEAGLRSHDRLRPWPEEDFRVAIDAEAQLLFAPTALSAANLRREGVRGAIHVTGNTALDALGPRCKASASSHPRLLVTCHRRESWGDGIRAVASALRRIAADGLGTIDVLLHPNPRVTQEMVQLLGECRGISLRAPCGHLEMLEMMTACDLLLSDSGGVQEEAPALGVPLLVLRDRTERPEGIASGNMILVGTDPDRIVAAVRRLLGDRQALAAMSVPSLPFGEPGASARIAGIVEGFLGKRAEAPSGPHPASFASRAAASTASA
jgi:UDP-N-acetylglucosamine 2-epimerase (non-hydrolysing)